jgi:hypothetical protein
MWEFIGAHPMLTVILIVIIGGFVSDWIKELKS